MMLEQGQGEVLERCGALAPVFGALHWGGMAFASGSEPGSKETKTLQGFF